MDISTFKTHFYSGLDSIQFNNSGQAAIPDVNRNMVMHWLERFYREGALCAMEGWAQTEVTRKKLAKFLGADISEVSYFQTTASALSQAALGIKLNPGDEILTWDQEYPSNFYPWRLAAERSGAKLVTIESKNYQTPAQMILDRVTDKTKVIAVSWVQYQTGALTDLKMIASQLKNSGIWLVADLIQGVGVRPFNFHDSGFDIVCGGSHKWLCSSYGVGYMVVKKERMQDLNPLEVGAMTYGNPDTIKSFSIQPKSDASRYEPGSKSMFEIIALGATLDLFTEVGIENIYKEACRLGDRLRTGLLNSGYKVFSPEGPIINFAPQDTSQMDSVAKKLEASNVSFAKRGPGLRLSVHAYNRDSEVDHVLKLLGNSQ